MRKGWRIFAVILAVLIFVGALSLLPQVTAQGAVPSYGCVDGPEWQDLQDSLDSPKGGSRRSVIEKSWGVVPVGHRNEYWDPANPRLYSYAYKFCQDSEVLIVLVYRKTSGAWQIALKGSFI